MNDKPVLAARALTSRPFHVMELLARAARLEQQGHRCISMVVGEPDFPAPEPVIRAAQKALQGGNIHYTHALGLPTLRKAIAEDYRRRDGLSVPIDRIAVTAGASGALLLAMAALINPGDEVLMPDPSYPCNREFVAVMGGVVRTIPVDAATQYQPMIDQVSRAWSAKTRMLLLASPANPTGTMLTTKQAADLLAYVRSVGGVMVVDEIYQRLVFDSQPASLLSLGEDLISINSFSKTWSMTGWRLGWMVAPFGVTAVVERLAQNLFISPSSLAQQAALAAFEPESLEIAAGYRDQFRRHAQYLIPELSRLGFRISAPPQGAFYAYCDVSALTNDSYQFCLDLCDQAKVLITPGRDFGEHRSHQYVRVSFTKPIELLQEGVARIARFLSR